MASTWGTVKLTVAVTVIPSATHSSSTSRPARVTGSLTAMLGAQAWCRCAMLQHRLSVARAGGVDLRAGIALRAVPSLVDRFQLAGGILHHHLHEQVRLFLGVMPAGSAPNRARK